ncbi:MAG TPA: [Fe-Fe] hydrogenase large subunit C-terminal domain-containing protein [Spirochaetota bacterium]|nr:[Fe-Fe] hydrogenase large subunit C-terminal domain-containing protein [Spirochaetota bacterium]
MEPVKEPLVQTIKEKCRVCYTCVRECPAKAIRIYNGQAEVIQERCIGCGNCFKVCTQQAKKVRSSIEKVEILIDMGKQVVATVAPSFAAEFNELDYRKFTGILRALGFSHVVEVAFGADLVSYHFKELVTNNPNKHYISTSCPSIVSYIEKFHPGLVRNLAPIASPMIAIGRVIHEMYGDDTEIVFIGPCLAKKDEAEREDMKGIISEVLTFSELRDMIEKKNITLDTVEPSDFDPPHPGKGTLFPIGRGMLQSAGIQEDLMTNTVFATDGTKQFVHTLKEFEKIPHGIQLLELLCCNGCIMGPAMTTGMNHFSRRAFVSKYAQSRYQEIDLEEWEENMETYRDVNLDVQFIENDRRFHRPTKEALQSILQKLGKFNPEDELNCGACGYDTCIDHATAIYMGMAESEMCLPYTIETLKDTALELKSSYEELVSTKNALIQSEKLASLGRMASGIAHEINNPLTGVLTYSSLMLEDLKETDFSEDLNVIIKETLRCREIVRGLLDFARESTHEKIQANINEIISNTLHILEHHVSFQSITIKRKLDENIPFSSMDVNQMRSVINNLAENAAHAMPDGGTLVVTTRFDENRNSIILGISDTGLGIDEENLNRIFDPFFTTKSAGSGTGLGLAVVFGIIRQHDGTIQVESQPGKGTSFIITLPVE